MRRYDPAAYEDAGKALAISILDLTESNPWTRLTCSACKNLKGVRDAIKRDIKQSEEASANRQKSAQNKNEDANSSGGGSSSPTRRGRRHRNVATASTGLKVPAKSEAASDKLSAVKAPVSPDSYRPVTKIPRKNSQGVKQSADKKKRPVSSGGGGSKTMLQRSKSIPNVPSVAEPFMSPASPQQQQQSRAKLTRSKSNPGSRPQSPRRLKTGEGLKLKKPKKKAGAGLKKACPESIRKNSDASTASSTTTVSESSSSISPSRKKKLSPVGGGGAGRKKKKRKSTVMK